MTTYIPINNSKTMGYSSGAVTGNQLPGATGRLGGGMIKPNAQPLYTFAIPVKPLPGTGVAGSLTVGYPS